MRSSTRHSVDAGEDTGRVEELVERVRGTSDDPVATQEAESPSVSPEPEEDQK